MAGLAPLPTVFQFAHLSLPPRLMVMVGLLNIPLVLSVTIQVHSSARVLRGLVLPLPIPPVEISTYFQVALVEAD